MLSVHCVLLISIYLMVWLALEGGDGADLREAVLGGRRSGLRAQLGERGVNADKRRVSSCALTLANTSTRAKTESPRSRTTSGLPPASTPTRWSVRRPNRSTPSLTTVQPGGTISVTCPNKLATSKTSSSSPSQLSGSCEGEVRGGSTLGVRRARLELHVAEEGGEKRRLGSARLVAAALHAAEDGAGGERAGAAAGARAGRHCWRRRGALRPAR